MNYNQQAPLQGKAEELASYGRYGDSMLVHMNPIEVEGIAALTPGGLTTNPVTGQPEAFAFLIPMLASMAGGNDQPTTSGKSPYQMGKDIAKATEEIQQNRKMLSEGMPFGERLPLPADTYVPGLNFGIIIPEIYLSFFSFAKLGFGLGVIKFSQNAD